ncbi:MAG: PilZ domain-containing protein [Planctomycetota bacterium]|jgi:hypothetical protein
MTESNEPQSAERPVLADPKAPDVLSRLGEEVTDEAKSQRAHDRVELRARVQVQPGNISEREAYKVQGVLGDLSDDGMQALFPRPLGVGDFFYIQFDRSKVDLPGVLALCKRCRQVRSDAFESGFSFVQMVNSASALGSTEGAAGNRAA